MHANTPSPQPTPPPPHTHTHRVRTRRREDLEALLVSLSINAANPICVLTQDTARNFFSERPPRTLDGEYRDPKYTLYMRGTGLDLIQEPLAVASTELHLLAERVDKVGCGWCGRVGGLVCRRRRNGQGATQARCPPARHR